MNFTEALLRDSCQTKEAHEQLDELLGRNELDASDRRRVALAAGGDVIGGGE